jgi:hypothetical protein
VTAKLSSGAAARSSTAHICLSNSQVLDGDVFICGGGALICDGGALIYGAHLLIPLPRLGQQNFSSVTAKPSSGAAERSSTAASAGSTSRPLPAVLCYGL